MLAARFCAIQVSSTTPTTEMSEEAFKIKIASLTSAGRVSRSAIGARMRTSCRQGESPTMSAASTSPLGTLMKPPRRFSAW